MTNVEELCMQFGGVKPIDGDEFAPVSEEELQLIEAHLAARLPEAYRRFLNRYGACSPKRLVHFNPVARLPTEVSTSGKGHVAVFYGTGTRVDDAYSVRRRMRFFAGRVPANLIPVADNGMGNQVLLGVSGGEAGKVYYWDSQNEPPDDEDYFAEHGRARSAPAMFENVHPIADSFEDFLRRLEADPE